MKRTLDLNYIDLIPTSHARGNIILPGSKSISNRILLLAALSTGTTFIQDLLLSDDTSIMLMALKKLGVQLQHLDPNTQNYIIYGTSGIFPVRQTEVFMGNAGTVIRPLTAVLAVLGGHYVLHGAPRMHARPIGDLVDALNAVGMCIEYMNIPNYPPIRILSGTLNMNLITVRGHISSQFLTAILMAAPFIAKTHDLTIKVIGELISKPYINITLNLMRLFGIHVIHKNWQIFNIHAGQQYLSPGKIHVEGDASSASYFLAAAAITGGPIRVYGIGKNSIQGDLQFIDILRKMGVKIILGDNWIESSSDGVLRSIDEDCNHIPDAAMTVAILALYANGTSTLRNISSWRVKESDRLTAMATELRKLGAIIEEGLDYLRIVPPQNIVSATINTYDDHRIAMCFSLASLNNIKKCGGHIRINNPKCVAKTFPEYFNIFKTITQ